MQRPLLYLLLSLHLQTLNANPKSICATLLQTFPMPEDANVAKEDPFLRQALYEVFGGIDYYSGKEISIAEMSVDHILPTVHGGPNNIYNYVPTTNALNSRKGATMNTAPLSGVLGFVQNTYSPKVLARYNELKSKATTRKREKPPKAPAPDVVSMKERVELDNNYILFISPEGKSGMAVIEEKLRKDAIHLDPNSREMIKLHWNFNSAKETKETQDAIAPFYLEARIQNTERHSTIRVLGSQESNESSLEIELNPYAYTLLRKALK